MVKSGCSLVLGKNHSIYEVRKNDCPHGGVSKILFLDPHFTIIFKIKIVIIILGKDFFLRVNIMVDQKPYCVLGTFGQAKICFKRGLQGGG